MSMVAIQVKYEFIDGHHVFTSNDINELLVVSNDPKTAFDDVALSIQTILELSKGITCVASPMQFFSDFINKTKDEEEATPYLPVLASQSYALASA